MLGRPALLGKGRCADQHTASRELVKDGFLQGVRKGTHQAGDGTSRLRGEADVPELSPSSSPLPYRPNCAAYCRCDLGVIPTSSGILDSSPGASEIWSFVLAVAYAGIGKRQITVG
jgi:hypothetical protein